MQINVTTLEQYLKDHRTPVNVFIDTADPIPCFRFQLGEDTNGSRTEYLTFDNVEDILEINEVEMKMIAERDKEYHGSTTREKFFQQKEDKITEILYGTLGKYIIQLFAAGLGKIIYPEIKILEGHTRTHFASAHGIDK